MSNAVDFKAMANAAAAQADYTKVQEGGNFERELPEAGPCLIRLREYIEMGLCDTASKMYPNKKPAQKARFVFEVVTPRHVKTVEKDGNTFKIAPSIAITCVISASEKSNFIKLFKQLNWAGKATHPAQCLGQGYMAEIVLANGTKNPIDANNPAKYANLQKDGVYTLQPPRKVDALSGTAEDIAVPELNNDMKLFLWNNPTQECWDSLFIDGTYEKDGQEVSKNWIQNMLKEALDFADSPLYQMLNGGQLDLPTEATEPTEEQKQDRADAVIKEENAKIEQATAVDPLAAVGI